MYPCYGKIRIRLGVDDFIDDVIRSKIKLNISTSITSLIFILHLRSNAGMSQKAWLLAYSTAGITSNKSLSWLFRKCHHVKHSFNLTFDMDRSSEMHEKFFRGDDVIDEVTRWPQIRPSLFPYEWKTHIFCDNWTTNEYFIIKLGVHMYHGIVNMPLWISMDYIIDDVIRSKKNVKSFNCNSSVNIYARASIKSSKCHKNSWLFFRFNSRYHFG